MVHQYKLNGYNIVIDEGSGSVHSVDEVAYDMIEMYSKHPKEEIVDAMLENIKTVKMLQNKSLKTVMMI